MKNDGPQKIHLKDYTPFPFTIGSASLAFALHPTRTIVSAKLSIQKTPDNIDKEIDLILDGEGLEIVEIKINGRALEASHYEYANDKLVVKNPKPAKFFLETKVAINPSENKALSGLYMSSNRFCTQCEAEGFRRITFFADRPDVLSHFYVRLEAQKDEYPILLANGNLVAFGDYGDGRHFAEWDDPFFKPSYLFAIVAGGNLDVISDKYTTIEDNEVELNIYVDKGDASKAYYAMDSLKRSMKWDEENYSRAYDLDVFNIVAVRDFNFGAMENKGLNIFNSSLLLADAQTATDFDFSRIESVVAHEYFHNWSGNRVTCRDWFQLSLKEGLTVFRDQEFSADQRSRSVCRIQDVIGLRSRQFLEDNGPNAHSVRPDSYASIDNFYTSTIYEKGAEIIRIAQNILGINDFLAGAVNYFEDNDGRAATIEDWLKALGFGEDERLSGIQYWYSQAGTPIINATSEFDAANKRFVLNLIQETPDTPNQTGKLPVPIPIKMAFFDRDGMKLRLVDNESDETIQDLNFTFNTKEASLSFEGIPNRPVVSMLRGFSAPVKLISDQSDEDLAILAAHDDDAFVRWEAVQTLARKEIIAAHEILQNGGEFIPSSNLIDIFAKVFDIAKNDYAYGALLLQLPSSGELMQFIKDCEPEHIFKARETISKFVFEKCQAQILQHIKAYDFKQEFKPDAKSAGVRAFLGSCLYLASFAKENAGTILANAFDHAQNMTDTMSALSAFSRLGGDEWQNTLNKFYDKWNSNPLVMDKWFSIQSSSPQGDAIDNFNRLIAHKDFEMTNPNRVRAVAASFGLSNPIGFHRKDGEGYRILVDFILKLDGVNHNVAARLATAFERATMVSPQRRAIAKTQLNRILNEKTSTQLQEIVAGIVKSL